MYGELALIFYICTTIPGIFRRFGFSNSLSIVLMRYRRQIGIVSFLLAIFHVLPRLSWFIYTSKAMGMAAFSMMFLLFITSNNYSQRLLRQWWKKIHNLTYIIVLLLFFHLALRELSIWTILIGITLFAQISSHIYAKRKVK